MNINETNELFKSALANPLADDVNKAWTQSGSATTGLTAYDLEAPAKTLYPVLTPLRNRIPRVSGNGGIQANWKAITGINVGGISSGLAEGKRGGTIATTVKDYLASYRGLGLDDFVTFEADMAANGFDDAKARATQGLLRSVMIGEENVLLGGNTSVNLGITPTPTLSTATTGGTIAAGTVSVICVALGYDAYWSVAGLNNGNVGQSLPANFNGVTIPASVTRTNADGTIDTYGGGTAQKSVAASVTTTGATSTISASVAPVAGAVGYAWFYGVAGSEVLGAVTNINSVVLTAPATGTQNASAFAADNSTNGLLYDGLLSQILKAGSGAYVKVMPTGTIGTGTPLTADGAGGIVEIDAAFAAFWNQYRLSPDTIYVNAQELLNINKKIIAGGAAPLFRFNLDAENMNTGYNAGSVLGSYLNKITNTSVQVKVHPTLPAGTLMFYSDSVPYSLSGVQNVLQVRARRDYYQIEYPLRTRKYEYGVYLDAVLQNYFPPAFGVITNIANG